MNLSSTLDYVIAIIGILIIAISFAWNIYDVFIHKASTSSNDTSEDSKDSHSADSTIR